jgi:heme exporter protein B
VSSGASGPTVEGHSSLDVFKLVVARDLKLAARRWADGLLPLVFFVVACALFPFGVGSDVNLLRQVAPGVIWVALLLSVTLSVNTLYAADHADGTLEQMVLSGQSLAVVGAARALAHALMTGLPLIVVSPLIALMFGLPGEDLPVLMVTLALGTPTLSLLANLGAALVVGVRSGAMLLFLLVLPLMVPVLIFGAGALLAHQSGVSFQAQVSLLAALCIGTCLLAPWAIGQALKIAVE